MKKILLLTSLNFLLINLYSQNTNTNIDTLTNAKIIQLTKLELASSVIINKIKTSINQFDVSTNALIELSNNKVATDVINEMMKVSNAVVEKILLTSNDPSIMHKQGIYYYNQSDATNPLKRVDAGIVSGYRTSSGGYGGFGGSSTMANLSGSESRFVINEATPTFYFYFDKDIIYRVNDWSDISSPNEFSFVKLMIKKADRFFKVGSSGSFGYGGGDNQGIPQKDVITFDYTQISEGIYKVTFKEQLKKGEYCFVITANTRKVFDFKIEK